MSVKNQLIEIMTRIYFVFAGVYTWHGRKYLFCKVHTFDRNMRSEQTTQFSSSIRIFNWIKENIRLEFETKYVSGRVVSTRHFSVQQTKIKHNSTIVSWIFFIVSHHSFSVLELKLKFSEFNHHLRQIFGIIFHGVRAFICHSHVTRFRNKRKSNRIWYTFRAFSFFYFRIRVSVF